MTFFRWVKQNRVFISAIISAIFFYLSQPILSSILSGLIFVILGEVIRTWSSGNIRKNRELATDGPYAYTRNPLYLGSFFIGLGFVVICNSFSVGLIFLITFSLIYWGVITTEEEDLAETFGVEFVQYTERVPRFFPRASRVPYGSGEFDWKLVLRHREYHTWMGILAAMIILIIKMLITG